MRYIYLIPLLLFCLGLISFAYGYHLSTVVRVYDLPFSEVSVGPTYVTEAMKLWWWFSDGDILNLTLRSGTFANWNKVFFNISVYTAVGPYSQELKELVFKSNLTLAEWKQLAEYTYTISFNKTAYYCVIIKAINNDDQYGVEASLKVTIFYHDPKDKVQGESSMRSSTVFFISTPLPIVIDLFLKRRKRSNQQHNVTRIKIDTLFQGNIH